MAAKLKNRTWNVLIDRIKRGRLTPFLGAGASWGVAPLAREIAMSWAEKYEYPLQNPENLSEVAQFLAVQYDRLHPKELLLEEFADLKPPDFDEAGEPHGVLAQLPLPVYITTNYDHFMAQAVAAQTFREPRQGLCRWDDSIREGEFFEGVTEAKVGNPIVYHLHGHSDPKSLVLTEDDYLRFLSNMIRNPNLLPPVIETALAESSCVFIGYRLADWNFRVLFETLRNRLELTSVAVLLPPGETEEQREHAQEYLDDYYSDALDLEIYWGTAKEFCSELKRRWDESQSK